MIAANRPPIPVRKGPAVLAAFLLLAASLSTAAPVTNSVSRWPSLAEVRAKWDARPWDAVNRAAETGELTAQHYLGYCHAEGLRTATNAEAALRWYRRAMEAGYLPSVNNLGLLYQRGIIVPKDLAQTLRYYQIAADGGLAQAQVNLGVLYRQGIGVGQDPVEAVKWFRRAADQGHAGAMLELHDCYWEGAGVAEDREQAAKWLEKAANTGDAHAQYHRGYQLDHTSGKRNLLEAVRWYQLAADQDHTDAMEELAQCYLKGRGVLRDEERGLDWMRKAADLNNLTAVLELAELYSQGIGEPRNEADRPISLLLRAGTSGRAGAYPQLAFRFRHGVGTGRDCVAACRWALADRWFLRFNKLPDAASVKANPADRFSAVLLLYLRTTTLDDAEALRQIGELYLAGEDAPRSPVKAWPWLKLAADQGSADARARLAEIEKSLTAEELATARQQLPALVKTLQDAASAVHAATSRIDVK